MEVLAKCLPASTIKCSFVSLVELMLTPFAPNHQSTRARVASGTILFGPRNAFENEKLTFKITRDDTKMKMDHYSASLHSSAMGRPFKYRGNGYKGILRSSANKILIKQECIDFPATSRLPIDLTWYSFALTRNSRHEMSRIMRKPVFAYAKTMAQISCAVSA